jgi:signal transduction histidine kinase
MRGRAALVTVEVMSDLAGARRLSQPLAHRLARHRYTPAQLVAIDAAAVTLIVVGYAFLMPRPQPRFLASWQGAFWVAYAAAGLAVLFRRRWPRVTLGILMLIAVAALGSRLSGPFAFLVSLAVYSVAAVIPRQGRRVLLAAVVAVIILAATTVGGGEQRAPTTIAGVVLVLLGWLAAENTRATRAYARQQAERDTEKAAAAAAERAEQVQRALASERAEIARDLHDIVAHAMSVIAVRSGVARMVIDSDPQQAREALGIIETTTRRSLQEMRLLIGVLRADGDDEVALRPAPGLADLGRLVADAAAAGVTVDLRVEGTAWPLPPAADLSAYRIVQEALTNVARHAGPTHARVQLSYRLDELGIEITDDGPAGPRPAVTRPAAAAQADGTVPPSGSARAGGGHGLIGMRERVALFGGELTAGPGPAGFRVAARLHTAEADDAPAIGGVR